MSPAASGGGGAHSRKRARSYEREKSRRDERDKSRKDEKEARSRAGRDVERLHTRRDDRPPEKDTRVIRRDDDAGDLKESEAGRHRDGRRQQRRRFRDSFAPPPSYPSFLDGAARKGATEEVDRRVAPERSDVPRSGSYFQHDERGSAGYGGRHTFPRAAEKGRWNGPKEHSGAKFEDDKSSGNKSFKKDEVFPLKFNEDSSWKHDGFYELEAGATPGRIRSAIREKKLESRERLSGPKESGIAELTPDEKLGTDVDMQGVEGCNHYEKKRYEQSVGGSWDFRRNEGSPGYGQNQYRDRRIGTSGARGKDRLGGRGYNGRNSFQPSGFQVEKWKHDLYEEANRSPTPKNDEDKIAKLEALLAS